MAIPSPAGPALWAIILEKKVAKEWIWLDDVFLYSTPFQMQEKPGEIAALRKVAFCADRLLEQQDAGKPMDLDELRRAMEEYSEIS